MQTSQNYTPEAGYINASPSLTVPDQSLTLRELLTNYTRGQELPYGKQQPAFFDEDIDVPDLKRLDLVEIQELAEGNAHKASKLQKSLEHLDAQKAEQEFNLKVESSVEKRLQTKPPLKHEDAKDA